MAKKKAATLATLQAKEAEAVLKEKEEAERIDEKFEQEWIAIEEAFSAAAGAKR